MKSFTRIAFVIGTMLLLFSCTETSQTVEYERPEFYPSSKPCTRWWWFASNIKKPDVKHQLDWAKANNFGGVEIAWVYPLHRYDFLYKAWYDMEYPVDTPAIQWLSPEWSDVVEYTKRYADSIGLACDFTFGSAWPVAGANIGKEHTTMIYGDTSFRQTLTFAWGWPTIELVINHLDSNAFNKFEAPISAALKNALKGSKSALFTDSWEIKMKGDMKVWTHGFDTTFKNRFGYDIIPFMEDSLDNFPDVRYDYMLLIEDYVTNGFYKPYVKRCKELGAWSRVQCLAAPADIMSLYALVDIPETEAMLNNPNFSRIVSSSAALAGKHMVSSETFTCMYGFPGTYLREEQMADLKMVADALFAQGVNQHFYHGMPYNPIGCDSQQFFATTYFGPGGNLEEELPAFNSYMEKVSGIMQRGKSYSDVAVYLPYEDAVMKGPLPKERQRVWVWGEYEMRYVDVPVEVEGYHPLWINRQFLDEARFENGRLKVGNASFSTLYMDVKYIDIRALEKILVFAKKGLPICLKQSPVQPGKNKSEKFNTMVTQLLSLDNVSSDLKKVVKTKPLIEAADVPAYWCRETNDGTKYIFIAQKRSKNLVYPVYKGQSLMNKSEFVQMTINANGKTHKKNFEFKPYQSLLIKISPSGDMSFEDITFVPKTPEVLDERDKQRMYF